jgi:hypothetical protein
MSLIAILLVLVTFGAELVAAQPAAETVVAPLRTAATEPFLLGPPLDGGPAVVRASFYLRDINEIDDEAETFEFMGVLTLKWRDRRQAFDPAAAGVSEKVYQGAYQFNEVFDGWFPQVVLVNESGLYEKNGVVLRVRPDGTLILTETLNAVAEADLDLTRYPFDRQRLDAVFEVLGFDKDEVVLQPDSASTGPFSNENVAVWMPQWRLAGVSSSIQNRHTPYAGSVGIASSFVVTMDVQRKAMFTLRLVCMPLILIVMLSWSVFWMDRSSLGDRINVSFIGILTVVAYQLVVSELLPRLSYVTFMNAFLNISFFVMVAGVVINLVVGALDKRGKFEAGDRIDYRCRWIFPIAYFGLVLLSLGAAFTSF